MSDCGGHPEKCKMCGKKGLPILLTRYAVATRDTSQWYTDPRNSKKTKALMQASGAPEISGDFVMPDVDMGASAYYTLRLLRGGYVYMYDEARNTWKGYFLTEESSLIEFTVQETFGQAAIKGENPGKKNPCQPIKFNFLAKCVTVENPEEATNLWFAFSDVQWTEAVWKKFDENKDGIREKQMRKFDVATWLKTQKSPHACLFNDAPKHVAEYCESINPVAFDFSSVPLARLGYYNFEPAMQKYKGKFANLKTFYREDEFARCLELIEEYAKTGKIKSSSFEDGSLLVEIHSLAGTQKQDGKFSRQSPELDKLLADSYISPLKMGLAGSLNARQISSEVREKMPIVALDDTPGITMDLASLMSARHVTFTEQDGYKRKVFASASIVQFKNTVIGEAEVKALEKKQEEYLKPFQKEVHRRGGPRYVQTPVDDLTPEQQEGYYAIELKPEEREKIRQETWAQFSKMYPNATDASQKDRPLFDDAAREKFDQEYAATLAEFDRTCVFPLAQAHSKWVTSDPLIRVFANFFDPEDVDSGMVYVSAFLMCINNTQDKGPCNEVYARWIESGDVESVSNLLMRSTVLNQNVLAKMVRDTTTNVLNLTQEGLEADKQAKSDKALQDKVSGIEAKANDYPLERISRLFYNTGIEFTKYVAGRSETPPPQYSGKVDRLKREDQVNRLLTHLYHQVIGCGVKHLLGWAKTRLISPFMVSRNFYTGKQFVIVNLYAPQYVHWDFASTADPYGSFIQRLRYKWNHEKYDAIRRGDPKMLERYMWTKPEDVDKMVWGQVRSVQIDFNSMTEVQRNRFAALMSQKGSFGMISGYGLECWEALGKGEWDKALKMIEDGREAHMKSGLVRVERKVAKFSNRTLTIFGTYTAFAGFFSSMEVMNEIDGKGSDAQQKEAEARFATSITTLVSSWTDIASHIVQFQHFHLKYGTAVVDTWVNRLTRWGRMLGIPGALVSVALDVRGYFDARAKGQHGLAAARFASGTLGVLSIVFLCTTFAFIGLIVLIGMVITSILISLWEDHPFRDWIGKCSFGHYPDDIKYRDAEEEIRTFQGISGTSTKSSIVGVI
jgi:hypothetical protein